MAEELREFADPDALARGAAAYVNERARLAIATGGTFHWAVSGGSTPWAMFEHLVHSTLDWAHTVIYQVDERVAPAGDPSRNLTRLRAIFETIPVRLEAMPVNDEDLGAAAQRYGAALPARFDLVHLGLGPDGHTASLVPDDPVLEVNDRLVALSEPYQGHRRMTLTYPALARADQILWLVAGADKREALAQLLGGDVSIPAGRVHCAHSLVLADRAAADQ